MGLGGPRTEALGCAAEPLPLWASSLLCVGLAGPQGQLSVLQRQPTTAVSPEKMLAVTSQSLL
jgi:hypothetical protein